MIPAERIPRILQIINDLREELVAAMQDQQQPSNPSIYGEYEGYCEEWIPIFEDELTRN